MKFTCDRCDAQYMISDEKVGPNGVKVRCKKCSHIIMVRRPENGAAASGELPAIAPTTPMPGEGLDAELGQAFDNAFGGLPGAEPSGGAPAPAASPAAPAAPQDLESTQAVSPDEAAKLAARSAAPEPAATEWYVAIGQAQVGPLPLTEVRRKWEAGDVGPDSLVWRPGMGDWSPLTSVSDLAAYLAPVPRGAVRPKAAPTPAPAPATRTAAAMPAAAPGPQLSRGEVSWKPTGASALAALASEELSAQPEARSEPKPAVSARSLMEGLPDGGGVDPTGAIPLQIKALEETGEQPAKSSVARGAERLRKKRSTTTRALVAVILALLVALGAGAGYVFKDKLLGGGSPRVASQLPSDKPTAAVEPAAPPKPPPAEPAPAATGTAATATATQPAADTAAAKPPEPPPAEPKPEPKADAKPPEPKPAVAAKDEKPRPEPRAARGKEKKPAAPARVAKADPESAAAPPPKKKGGDLLDFDGGGDSALDEALGNGGSGRSVYVPPAPGGGGGLAEHVTDSQVNETIMTRVSALQQCLADKGGGGGGVLKMRWTIAPDGGVQSLKCITPETANTPFATCVTGVLKGLRFPKTSQGRKDVTFPFKF